MSDDSPIILVDASGEAALGTTPDAQRRRRARGTLAVLILLSTGGIVAVRALNDATPTEVRDAVPAARPSLDGPVDVNASTAKARRVTQPSGADGVGAGAFDAGPTNAAAPAGVRAAAGTSVQAAIDAAGPGGTVVIGAGVHRDQFDLRPRNDQTIVGEPGAILNGSRVVSGFSSSGSTWVAGGQPTAVPATSAPCLAGFVRCGSPDDLFYDSRPLKRVDRAGAVVADTWFYDYAGGLVVVGNNPNGHTVELSVPGQHAFVADQGRGGNGVTLTNVVVEKYGTPAQECAVMTVDAGGGYKNVLDPNNGTSGGWTITNSTFRFNHGCGVFAGPGTVVSTNQLVDNGQLGVKGAGRNVRIVRNQIGRNNFAGHDTYWEAGGTKFFNAVSLYFGYNHVFDNVGSGAWTDYSLFEIAFDHNTFERNNEGGISAEMTLSGSITFNEFFDNDVNNIGDAGKTHGGIFLFNASNFDVSGNLLRGNNGGIIAQVQDRGCVGANITQLQGQCPAGAQVGSINGTKVHDNVIELDKGFSGLLVLPYADHPPYAQVPVSWAISQFKAISFDDNVYAGSGFDSSRGTNGNVFDLKTNRFVWGFPSGFSTDPNVIWSWIDRRFLGFADWQAFAGQDAHGVLRSP